MNLNHQGTLSLCEAGLAVTTAVLTQLHALITTSWSSFGLLTSLNRLVHIKQAINPSVVICSLGEATWQHQDFYMFTQEAPNERLFFCVCLPAAAVQFLNVSLPRLGASTMLQDINISQGIPVQSILEVKSWSAIRYQTVGEQSVIGLIQEFLLGRFPTRCFELMLEIKPKSQLELYSSIPWFIHAPSLFRVEFTLFERP